MSHLSPSDRTFLLTDIEGSTRLWDASPEAMGPALVRHDELIAREAARHDGSVVRTKGEGDSAFIVFSDTARAVSCATALQLAFADEAWPGGLVLRVRIAVHAGQAAFRAGDYYGGDVNRAARLRAAAHGGQLVVSDHVRRIVSDALPDGASMRDLGTHRLRDLSRPERIWQVVHPRLLDDFPPLRTLDLRGHNLPVQPTSFVGREEECAIVSKRLLQSPLTTLVGPGGIGKTRLALHSGASVIDAFGDGVWFAALDPLGEPTLLGQTVATALQIREERGRPILQTIIDHVTGRDMLLILDTCEHLVETVAPFVSELLGSCEGLRILATSREPLGVYGEALVDLGALEVPVPGLAAEALASSDAVRLFVERASLTGPDFALDADSAEVVAAICRRLEGIPLAIELAAALTRIATPEQILDRLEDRLAALTSGPRTVPERQRTMAATIAWSVDLLDASARESLASLSAFAGGFTLEMAAAVHEGDAASWLADLRSRSLLRVDDDGRYSMADTVREYASTLVSSAVREDLHVRHAACIAAILAEMRGSVAPETFSRLSDESDNLRSALRWSLDVGELEQASTIAIGVVRFWAVRGHLSEARLWLAELASALPARHPSRASVCYQAGSFAFAQGDLEAATRHLRDSREAAEVTDDGTASAVALGLRAAVEFQLGNVTDAEGMANEALETLRRTGPADALTQVLTTTAMIARATGDREGVLQAFSEALTIAREQGATDNIARALLNLGALEIEFGINDRAKVHLEEAVERSDAIGDRQASAVARLNLANLAQSEGDIDHAAVLIGESLAIRDELGDARGRAMCLDNLADVRRLQGRLGEAQAAAIEAIAISRSLGNPGLGIGPLETLGSIDVAQEQWSTALDRLACSAAARSMLGLGRIPSAQAEFDRCVEEIRRALGDGVVDARWSDPPELTEMLDHSPE